MENNDYFLIPGFEDEHIIILGRSVGIHYYYKFDTKTKQVKGLYESPLSEIINESILQEAFMGCNEFENLARKIGLSDIYLKELRDINIEESFKKIKDLIDTCLDNLIKIKNN